MDLIGDFKIDFFLDTNILVDYVQGENDLLNVSLDYLASSKFVKLHSSHYVEFEFTEVRKRNEFFKLLHGHYPKKVKADMTAVRSYGHNNWVDDGNDYLTFKTEVQRRVLDDVVDLKNRLHVDFDDYVLHENLVNTTCDIVLQTKISREDSMVLMSCMYPRPEEVLSHCVILTNDQQYSDAYQGAKQDVNAIFAGKGISIPCFYNIKSVPANQFKNDGDIRSFWNRLVLDFIKRKKQDIYLGHTVKPSKTCRANGCIKIDIEDGHKKLYDSDGFFFVARDLSDFVNLYKGSAVYYNDKIECSKLPVVYPNNTMYSIKLPVSENINVILNDEKLRVMSHLQNNKYLVFYDEKVEEK